MIKGVTGSLTCQRAISLRTFDSKGSTFYKKNKEAAKDTSLELDNPNLQENKVKEEVLIQKVVTFIRRQTRKKP